MPSPWLSWRRSLACKLQPGEVHDPQYSLDVAESRTYSMPEAAIVMSSNRKLYMRSGCSRSISNLRDVIHSSRRMDNSGRVPAMPNFSPKSVESNDFVQSISHEALLHDHGCDHHPQYNVHHNPLHQNTSSLRSKLSLEEVVAHHHPHPYHHQRCAGTSGSFYGTPLHPSARVGMQEPGTPVHHFSQGKGNALMKLSGCNDCKNPAVSAVQQVQKIRAAAVPEANVNGQQRMREAESNLPPIAPKAICQRCGEPFSKYEALEQHHLLKHAVVELHVGDSSRNVVEIIFRTSWLHPAPEPVIVCGATIPVIEPTIVRHPRIHRVLKVNNLPRILARFEDYREGVKMRASKLPKKHPRCLADGNELLRFYGAKLECGLMQDAASLLSICSSSSCTICKIIRLGFPKIRVQPGGDGGSKTKGILTTATSGRAHELLISQEAILDTSPSAIVSTTTTKEMEPFSAPPMMSAIGNKEEANSSRSRRHNNNLLSCEENPDSGGTLKAMLVCRVIAGRVHKPQTYTMPISESPPTQPLAHIADSSMPCGGFDSMAGRDTTIGGIPPPSVGLYSRFEELTVFNSRAILPCFVVLYKW